MEYKIEKAQRKDLKSTIKLALMLQKYECTIDPGLKKAKELTKIFERYHRKNLNNKKKMILVAKIDNKVVGFALASIEKRMSIFKEKRAGHIDDIFILPKHRRKGIAREFVKKISEWFKRNGIKIAVIYAYKNNKLGMASWTALGFKEKIVMLERIV